MRSHCWRCGRPFAGRAAVASGQKETPGERGPGWKRALYCPGCVRTIRRLHKTEVQPSLPGLEDA